ncbi:MAG: ATP-binding cassette domain-containing protein, partial [Arenicellales bacterium]
MKALTIQDLYKQYAGGTTALKGVSLEVDAGDFFALLGPNGAGKSTMMRIVCGILEQSYGKIWING